MTEYAYGIIPFYKVQDDWEVFLIHQYGSAGDMLWTFPKGRPNLGETPIETARRECLEETGISPHHVFSEHPLSTSYAFVRKGVKIEKTSTYYFGIVKDRMYTIQQEEVKEAGWFNIKAARAKLTFADYKKLLDDAMSFLDKL